MSRIKHRTVCYECEQFIVKLTKAVNGKLSAKQEAHIKTMRGHMTLLAQAWSVMAGRNLISDILRALTAMEGDMPAEAKANYVALKQVVTKAVGTHQVTNSRYDSVLCLGFRVKTGGDKFSGATDDWQDMSARCNDMKAAIRAAYNLVEPKHRTDGKILKIFMAPEFFFRGRNGAYDFSDITGMQAVKGGSGVAPVKAKQGLLDLMRDEIDKPIYNDWLFVLGTVIGATKVTKTVCGDCGGELRYVPGPLAGKTVAVCQVDGAHKKPVVEKVQGAQVDNVAFVCKEKEVFTVSKELVSGIDFVTDKSLGKKDIVSVRGEQLKVIRHDMPSGYEAASGVATKFTDERMGGSVFTLDGVTFGLEVCLDHAATTQANNRGRLAGAANIQVQLIPSAGMWIGSFSTLPKGVVFNVDGSVPHVQAVGLNADTAKIDMHADVGDGRRKYDKDITWDTTHMAANLDLMTGAHLGKNWKKASTPMVPAGSGKVLLYGPFELP